MEPFHLADYHSAYSAIDYHTIESLDVTTPAVSRPLWQPHERRDGYSQSLARR